MHGAAGFRAALDEKLDLARMAAARIAALPALNLVAPPDLSLLAFRVAHPDPREADARTRRLAARVNAAQRVLVTGVEVDGRYLVRVCVLSFRTHAAQIDALLEDLEAGLGEG